MASLVKIIFKSSHIFSLSFVMATDCCMELKHLNNFFGGSFLLVYFILVCVVLSCLFLVALWSPAGKGLTS